MRLLALVEYDGTEYAGFQLQARRGSVQPRTVQRELEAALSLCTGQSVTVIASGRTDTGGMDDMDDESMGHNRNGAGGM